jgi:hypothetical protein
MVVMNTSNYETKFHDLISSSSYKPISKNSINTITSLITKAIKYSSLDPNIQKRLIPHNPQTPRIYGKPKIHKKDISLRPIVSAIGAPTCALSRFIVDKLQSFMGKTPSFIKDSSDFIQKTQHLHLDENYIMVSFDVISLFTKILVPEALNLISNLVNPETLNLIEIFLTSTFFTFKGICYEQTKGTSMGSSLSSVVANIFMEHFEGLALNRFDLKPKCWFSFVDDTFVVWPHGQPSLISFFNHLNSISPHIQFTDGNPKRKLSSLFRCSCFSSIQWHPYPSIL